jgi:hypothetical protein
VPVVVRSNEPARARVELLAQGGPRHGLLTRTLKWANRPYPLIFTSTATLAGDAEKDPGRRTAAPLLRFAYGSATKRGGETRSPDPGNSDEHNRGVLRERGQFQLVRG